MKPGILEGSWLEIKGAFETKKLDVLRSLLSGSQNHFNWQLFGDINHQPCSRKQLESLILKVGKADWESVKGLIESGKLSCGCYTRQVRAPGVGFSYETGGNWSSREKESKVLHLDYMAYTPVPPV